MLGVNEQTGSEHWRDDNASRTGSVVHIVVKGDATEDTFESIAVDAFSAIYSEDEETSFCSPEKLIIDLTESQFVDLSTWHYILSIFDVRSSRSRTTKLRLPGENEGRRARDFMRLSNVPQALELVTKIKLEDLLCEESLGYWGEDPSESYRKFERHFTGVGYETVRKPSRNSFPVHTWRLGDFSDSRQVVEEVCDKWSLSEVSDVLRHKLAKPDAPKGFDGEVINPKDHIEARVVYEAVVNAIRHPGATTIQTSSHNDMQMGNVPVFTIIVWDNGKGVYDTLREALDAGKDIRREYNTIFDRKYEVQYIDFPDTVTGENLLDSSITPHRGTTEEDMFISTIFPGTTRDVSGSDHITSEKGMVAKQLSKKRIDEIELRRPGMGLHALIRCAVDDYGGSVTIRSGHLSMNIEKSVKNKTQVAIGVTRMPTSFPIFHGNMLTIRIPVDGK